MIDQPRLNVRLEEQYTNPTPIVMWGNNTEDLQTFKNKYNNFLFYVENEDGSFSDFLLRNKINTGLVEGGNKVLSYFFEHNYIDKFYMFRSSKKLKIGTKLDSNITNFLHNGFQTSAEFQINDNLLSTYTIK